MVEVFIFQNIHSRLGLPMMKAHKKNTKKSTKGKTIDGVGVVNECQKTIEVDLGIDLARKSGYVTKNGTKKGTKKSTANHIEGKRKTSI